VHAVLVGAAEVDHAVLALVATADVTRRDAALVVAATRLGERAEQRLLRRRTRDLGEVGHRRAAATGSRGLVVANSHIRSFDPSQLSGDSREDVDGARLEGHDGALGVLALARAEAGAAGLALTVQGVHRGDLHAEDLLDRELDLGLVRAGVHDERVLALVDQSVALLRDDRREDDVARVLVDRGHAETSLAPVFIAMNASMPALVETTSSLRTTS